MATLCCSFSELEARANIDDRIAELQQAVSDLQAQIQTLRTQRNAFSPICRLPSEVLSTIFIHYARIIHENTPMSKVVPEWVNVSYVCRHWRDVALSCPALWSHIFTVSQPWIELLLSRSKHAPLRIRFKWYRGKSGRLDILERLLGYLERIEQLQLVISFNDYEKFFSMLSSPAPVLRSLFVHVETTQHLAPATVPAIPALRRLELSRCPLLPFTHTLGNLTTLVLYNSFEPIHDLATTLQAMHRLVHIELRNTLRKSDTNSTSINLVGDLRFPHLRGLLLEDAIPCVTTFLAHLNISPQTEVKIRTSRSSTRRDWKSFRSVLAKIFFASGNYSTSPIRTILIDFSGDCKTTLAFSGSENTDWDPELERWGCHMPLQILMFDDYEPTTTQEIVYDAYRNGFLSSLQGSRVTTSFVNWGGDLCSPILQDILGSVPKLKYIRFTPATRKRLRCFLSFLSLTPHPRLENFSDEVPVEKPFPMTRTFAPDLEELVIDASTFEGDEDHDWGEGCYGGDGISSLCDALTIRKENGYVLNRLTLSGYRNVSEEDVAKLEELVGEMVWDRG